VDALIEKAQRALRQKNYAQAAMITLAVMETMSDILLYMEQSSYHRKIAFTKGLNC